MDHSDRIELLERIAPWLYRLFTLLLVSTLLIGVVGVVGVVVWLGPNAWPKAASMIAAGAMALLGGLAFALWGLATFFISRDARRSRLNDRQQRELRWDLMMARHLPLEK
jgi:hypothetical protein